jgi:hypothetical protein
MEFAFGGAFKALMKGFDFPSYNVAVGPWMSSLRRGQTHEFQRHGQTIDYRCLGRWSSMPSRNDWT